MRGMSFNSCSVCLGETTCRAPFWIYLLCLNQGYDPTPEMNTRLQERNCSCSYEESNPGLLNRPKFQKIIIFERKQAEMGSNLSGIASTPFRPANPRLGLFAWLFSRMLGISRGHVHVPLDSIQFEKQRIELKFKASPNPKYFKSGVE
jgi:hypothetical protein